MIQLLITKTSKRYGANQDRYSYDECEKVFGDLTEAKEWLKNEYGKSKRSKMYHDDEAGQAVHSGYIYNYKMTECSRETGKWESYSLQDWVSFYSLESLEL